MRASARLRVARWQPPAAASARPRRTLYAPPPSSRQAAEGTPVELSLPAKGPQLPLAPPPPLRHTLVDALVPVPTAAVWEALFGAGAALLWDFHRDLGEREMSLTPWLQQGTGGGRSRGGGGGGRARRPGGGDGGNSGAAGGWLAGWADNQALGRVAVRAPAHTHTTPLRVAMGPRQAYNTGGWAGQGVGGGEGVGGSWQAGERACGK